MTTRFLLFFFFITTITFAQYYSDQHYYIEKENLVSRVSLASGVEISSDGKSIILSDGVLEGSVEFEPDSSQQPFNRGLPSWNGHVPNNSSSFKVLMRFYNNVWSPWLTVGFWKANVWSSYGSTSYSGGKIDYDYAVLNSFHSKWQFKVVMKRTNSSHPSPSLHKLSFFVSDQRTTDNVNITSIVNDKPAAIYIDTEHFYQYALDPDGIGPSICSPTSVSMVLRSYDIAVDPLQFAKDTKDPYYGIFGIWPRVVQHAAEYGLNGAVTRYRTWSETLEVLAAGGRVVMSVGSPLYPNGHLIMLAGFDSTGTPIVHDPAKSNGYAYKFNKTSLSQSWFSKGGVAYTFYPQDTSGVTSVDQVAANIPEGHYLFTNYPNPFNPRTNIKFKTAQRAHTIITVYDITGREIEKLFNDMIEPGSHTFQWNASNLPSGNYFIRVTSGNYNSIIKAVLVK